MNIDWIWGLILLPAFLQMLGTPAAATQITGTIALIVAAGVLVGIATRIGNGCTSGHGFSGISRLSPRGILATAIYITGGAAIVLLLRNLMGGF